AVACSLLVAVTLTPTLCARVLKHEAGHGRIFTWLEERYTGLERSYGRWLGIALRHPWLTLGTAGVSFVLGIVLAMGIPFAFSGSADRSEFEGSVELPLGVGVGGAKGGARRAPGRRRPLRPRPDPDGVRDGGRREPPARQRDRLLCRHHAEE